MRECFDLGLLDINLSSVQMFISIFQMCPQILGNYHYEYQGKSNTHQVTLLTFGMVCSCKDMTQTHTTRLSLNTRRWLVVLTQGITAVHLHIISVEPCAAHIPHVFVYWKFQTFENDFQFVYKTFYVFILQCSVVIVPVMNELNRP